jgi:sugar lactone lactonase YvrE
MGHFRAPTDVAFDSDDNVYIADGYTNSRVAKYDKNGNWVKSRGSRGPGGAQANENPGQFNTLHNIAVDRQNNVYVADRNNRRIQVFDRDGTFQRFLFLNARMTNSDILCSAMRRPTPRTKRSPGRSASRTHAAIFYTSDSEPGRIYKMTLDGKILARSASPDEAEAVQLAARHRLPV